MTTTASRIAEIGLVIIPSTDQDRSIEFYEALGFEKRTDVAFGDAYRWVEVYPPNGTTGIALAPPREGEPTGVQTGISLTTDDIDATHAHLQSMGVDVEAQSRVRVSRRSSPARGWRRDGPAARRPSPR
jgi:catechol 2,3-dioxygenase-like lactoylglutathione lyase family enzyme